MIQIEPTLMQKMTEFLLKPVGNSQITWGHLIIFVLIIYLVSVYGGKK